jgi:hypothetical protein
MIVWHWRGRARADTASAYIDHLREDTLARLAQPRGCTLSFGQRVAACIGD